MKKEIQINLLKEIISMARKAMVSEPVEQEGEEHSEESECPVCEGKDPECSECMEEVEEDEPDFSKGRIQFVKVKVKKPKNLKSIVSKIVGE